MPLPRLAVHCALPERASKAYKTPLVSTRNTSGTRSSGVQVEVAPSPVVQATATAGRATLKALIDPAEAATYNLLKAASYAIEERSTPAVLEGTVI